MSATRKAPAENSKGKRADRAVVLALAAAGAMLLATAEATPLLEVRTLGAVISERGTGPHHSYAQAVIAVAALVMASGWFAGASRPPLVALGALGVLALLIALAVDAPDTRAAGVLESRFEDARASPRIGLWLELGGAGLLVAASAIGLVQGAPRRARPDTRRNSA